MPATADPFALAPLHRTLEWHGISRRAINRQIVDVNLWQLMPSFFAAKSRHLPYMPFTLAMSSRDTSQFSMYPHEQQTWSTGLTAAKTFHRLTRICFQTPLFTLPRNLNDVARLALRALLRVLHHRCSAPRTTGYSNCHAGAGPEASQRSGDTRCRTVESLQAPQFPLLAHRLANVFGSTPPTPRAHATPRRSSHAAKLSRCQPRRPSRE